MRTILRAIILLFALQGAAWGANEFYCVAPSGTKLSGSNSITDNGVSCYGTIASVLSANSFNDNDQIVQLNATDTNTSGIHIYTETISWTAKGGADGHPLIIRGRSGDTVTISSGDTWGWTNDSDNITYQNLTFSGTSGSVGSFYAGGSHSNLSFSDVRFNNGAGYGWYGGNVTNMSITNCQFSANGYSGLGMSAASTGTITNSIFSINTWNGINGLLSGLAISACTVFGNSGHGIWHTGGSAAMSITQCTIGSNCDDYPTCADGHRYHGIVIGGGSANVSNFTISKNIISQSDIGIDIQSNSGYTTATGTIKYNLITNDLYNSNYKGVSIYFAGAEVGGVSSVTVYNNTIVSSASDTNAVALWLGTSSGSGNEFKNNIIVQTNGGYALYSETSTYPTMNYNDYYTSKATPFYDQGTDRNFTSWKTASIQDANSINLDPLLNASYGLQDNSPAKDSGVAITGLHSGSSITGGDAASNTWLYGTGIDIGAYEIWQGHFQHMFGFTQPIPKIYTIP